MTLSKENPYNHIFISSFHLKVQDTVASVMYLRGEECKPVNIQFVFILHRLL